MVAESLKASIEAYHQEMRESCPLFANARQGTLTARELERFVMNVHYLVEHTPVYLRLAARRAEELGQKRLAHYFRDKLGEEAGHDQWAQSDLLKLRGLPGAGRTGAYSLHLLELLEYLRATIEEDPICYLPYIFLAEYFTVLMTPEWLENLETHCAIPREAMSIVGNHAELDKEHVREGMRQIDALADSPEQCPKLQRTLHHCMNVYRKFCTEVGTSR